MMGDPVVFLQAVSATAASIAGLLFWRFWRETHDRLFRFFAVAFWLMAVSWLVLGLSSPSDETRPYVYAVRLIAFLLIVAAIVDKNRAAPT